MFSQTFTRFEVVITDDSPSAVIEDAIRPWCGDKRLSYYRNAVRLGSPRNWNKAIGLARGRLIKMLHQDDWFAYDESLQEYVALIERDPSTKFAFSAAVARDISGRLLFQHSPTDRQIQELRRDPRCLLQANFVESEYTTEAYPYITSYLLHYSSHTGI